MSDAILTFLEGLANTQPITPKVYSKKILSNQIKKKLLSFQEDHVVKLIHILLKNHVCLDSSDTGIGKTYISAAVCKELGRRPIIVCPKTLIFNWREILEYFGVNAYDIVNFETMKNGKTYKTIQCKSRKTSPFLEVIDPDPEDPQKIIHRWNLPEDAIIIFDEAHRCKDPSTENGKLLASTKQAIMQKIPVILLSATICEKFMDMKIPFYLFQFIPSTRNFNHYIKSLRHNYPKYKIRRHDFTSMEEYKTARENAPALMIYDVIQELSSRIRIKDLGDKFPSNQWCCQAFIAEESDKIAEAYEEISILMKELKENPGRNHLAQIQKLKQEIEFRKIPIFIEQAQLYLDEGKSVIIFVNFLDTLHFLSNELDIKCKIYGEQTLEERQEAINLFQSNQERTIILQIRAGGVGISLHDLHGEHPRVSLINFPDSAVDLIQALGRVARAGAKSPVLQRIIFVANIDYEKRIMRSINRKLNNVSAVNDGDLEGYKYKVKKVARKKDIPDKQKDDNLPVDVNLNEDREILDGL